MFKFATVGAALAAILSTQFTSNLFASQTRSSEQFAPVSASIVTNVLNAATDNNNVKVEFVTDSSPNTLEVEKLNSTRMLLGVAALGGTAIAVVFSAKKAQQLLASSSRPELKSKQDPINLNQASRKLQNQLMKLLHDDRDTANRLLSQVKIKNPNKPTDWYVEKVIYDLERDRGAY